MTSYKYIPTYKKMKYFRACKIICMNLDQSPKNMSNIYFVVRRTTYVKYPKQFWQKDFKYLITDLQSHLMYTNLPIKAK